MSSDLCLVFAYAKGRFSPDAAQIFVEFKKKVCKRKVHRIKYFLMMLMIDVVVAVVGFYVPPTTTLIQRSDLCFKYHSKDWRIPGSKFTWQVALPLHHRGF